MAKEKTDSGFEYDDSVFRREMLGFLQHDVNFKPIFKTIAIQFRKSRRSIFKLKGPGKYEDLTPEYKEIKKKKWGHIYPILYASGRIKGSVLDKSNPEAITEIKKNSLVIGSEVPYLVYHDSPKPRKKMPYRKVFFWGPERKLDPNLGDYGLPRVVMDTVRQGIARQLGLTPKQASEWKPEINWG